MKCMYCDESDPKRLRPYGVGGQPICPTCAKSTPERLEETERQFLDELARMNIPAGVVSALLGEEGLKDPGEVPGLEETLNAIIDKVEEEHGKLRPGQVLKIPLADLPPEVAEALRAAMHSDSSSSDPGAFDLANLTKPLAPSTRTLQ